MLLYTRYLVIILCSNVLLHYKCNILALALFYNVAKHLKNNNNTTIFIQVNSFSNMDLLLSIKDLYT